MGNEERANLCLFSEGGRGGGEQPGPGRPVLRGPRRQERTWTPEGFSETGPGSHHPGTTPIPTPRGTRLTIRTWLSNEDRFCRTGLLFW